LGVSVKCFGCEALLSYLWLDCVWFGGRDCGRGWDSIEWVGVSASAGEKYWMKKGV